jgi:hypothetical protein
VRRLTFGVVKFLPLAGLRSDLTFFHPNPFHVVGVSGFERERGCRFRATTQAHRHVPAGSARSSHKGGSQRSLPDHWLVQAELVRNARLLRLSYTSCTIEVAGRGLTPIFADACIG